MATLDVWPKHRGGFICRAVVHHDEAADALVGVMLDPFGQDVRLVLRDGQDAEGAWLPLPACVGRMRLRMLELQAVLGCAPPS